MYQQAELLVNCGKLGSIYNSTQHYGFANSQRGKKTHLLKASETTLTNFLLSPQTSYVLKSSKDCFHGLCT